MAAGEQSRTYTRPGCSTVEVTEDNRLRIHSPTGQTAEFTLSLAENGSYRAAEMAMDGVVRNITYNTAAQRNQQTFSVHFILNQSFI